MNSLKNNLFSYIYLKDQKKLIVIVFISLALASYLGFITPQLIKNLYQSYEHEGAVIPAIWSLVYLFIGEYFVALLYQTAINRYVQKLLFFIRAQSYKEWISTIEITGKGHDGDQKYPMGEVLSRILTDTEAVIEMVSTGSFKIFIDITFIISCLIGFVRLNTISGLALIVAEIIVVIALLYGSKKMATVYMEVRKSTGTLSRVIANLTGGFRYTFFHPHQNYASKTGYASFEDFLKKQLKANVWDASYFSLAESLFPILLALLVIIFPYSHIVEISVLAAIVDLIQRSIAPIKEFTGKISSIQRARTGLVRIEEFNEDLKLLPKSEFGYQDEDVQLAKLSVKIDHFKYPQKDTSKTFELKNISFEAFPGELIGIVGTSGCGKSTLLKILSTQIVAENSNIEISSENNQDIIFQGDNLTALRKYKGQVSIISQDSHVFSSSLKFNITLGHMNGDFDLFWSKVKTQIPYIESWGVKPENEINPKELSLGQKQLISALRSCYLTKPIVLFDEISSGLDSELEEALRLLVLMIQEHSLTFIVAHRIETILKAQQIFVMNAGEIVAKGTHAKLLVNSAPYQEFIAQLNKVH